MYYVYTILFTWRQGGGDVYLLTFECVRDMCETRVKVQD